MASNPWVAFFSQDRFGCPFGRVRALSDVEGRLRCASEAPTLLLFKHPIDIYVHCRASVFGSSGHFAHQTQPVAEALEI